MFVVFSYRISALSIYLSIYLSTYSSMYLSIHTYIHIDILHRAVALSVGGVHSVCSYSLPPPDPHPLSSPPKPSSSSSSSSSFPLLSPSPMSTALYKFLHYRPCMFIDARQKVLDVSRPSCMHASYAAVAMVTLNR